MKVIMADHYGICFGVRDAIAQAEQLAKTGPLTILGEIVHNPIVRERLRDQGVKEAPLNGARPTDGPVMFTAHGVSNATRKMWRDTGVAVSDGTCPLVKHAHEQLKQLVDAGFFPVVIGKLGHVEVTGLTGDFPEAVVLSAPQDVALLPARSRYGIISQTTQPMDLVGSIVDAVRKAYPKAVVRFVDTVCKPTKDRQLALKKLIGVADVIVIVGGRTSNNTRQLVETCIAAGRKAIHVERPEELDSRDFATARVVGLTGGTSTLPETVNAVRARLLEFCRDV